MAIIPPSLQPKARAYTVSEERKIKQYGSLEEARRQELVKETQRKIEGISQRLKKVSYENYLSEYNKIEESLKRYFISPEELYQTKEYKQYAEKKAKYQQALAKQVAYENVMKHYKKGMLWAVAAYGEGYEQELAKKLIKEGYSPALGGLIDQERQRIRNEMIIAQKELGAVEPTDFISKGLALAEQAPMGSLFLKEGEMGLAPGQVGYIESPKPKPIPFVQATGIKLGTTAFGQTVFGGKIATGLIKTSIESKEREIQRKEQARREQESTYGLLFSTKDFYINTF